MTRVLAVVAVDIRSAHNVGSLLRTADGLGVSEVHLCGITPYPEMSEGDARLPHIARKLNAQIDKTALGAASMVNWSYAADPVAAIERLQNNGYLITALEQAADSVPINKFRAPQKVALILGNEADGLPERIVRLTDLTVEIPMLGQKESFNVVQAAAMALFSLRWI